MSTTSRRPGRSAQLALVPGRSPTPHARMLSAALLAATLWATHASATPLAVFPVDGADLSTAERAAIDEALHRELKALDLELVPTAEVAQQVASAGELGLRCAGDDLPCMMKIGTIAGFERLLTVQATRTDAGVILALGLATVQPPKIDTVTEQTIRVDASGADVRGPVVAIFSPEMYTGSVLVKGIPDGARIFIDGEQRGTAPLARPIEGVKAGAAHDVRVEADGLAPINAQILVAFGQVAELELAMASAVGGQVGEVAAGPVERGDTLTEDEGSPFLSLPFHALLWSGAALTVVGAGAAIAGGAYMYTVDEYLLTGNDGYEQRLAAQRLGQLSAGVLSIGVLAMVAGIATSGSSLAFVF